MKVFLAGIMQGSLVEAAIHSQDWRQPVSEVLRARLPQAQVYCHYTSHPNSIEYGLAKIRTTLAAGNARAGECDVLVAYLPSASMGTAIEMHEAARNDRVVLTVSPLAANWVVRAYSDRIFADVAALDAFLAGGGLEDLIEAKRRP